MALHRVALCKKIGPLGVNYPPWFLCYFPSAGHESVPGHTASISIGLPHFYHSWRVQWDLGVPWDLGELPKDHITMLAGVAGTFRTAVASAASWCGLHTPTAALSSGGSAPVHVPGGSSPPCVGWGQGCTGLELVSFPMTGSGWGARITPISVSVVMGPLFVCCHHLNLI